MNVQVTIIDMKMKNINLFVDKSITIGNLRTLFKENGGNGSNNQWKFDGQILDDDNKKLKDIPGFELDGIAISITSNVRGGYIII